MKRIQENTVEIDFLTEQTEKGRLNLSDKQITTSAKVLAGTLLDYARAGGNLDSLTPKSVFGKKEKL